MKGPKTFGFPNSPNPYDDLGCEYCIDECVCRSEEEIQDYEDNLRYEVSVGK